MAIFEDDIIKKNILNVLAKSSFVAIGLFYVIYSFHSFM